MTQTDASPNAVVDDTATISTDVARAGPGASRRRGLHGHSFDANIVRVAAAECVGTALLVMTIVGTVAAASLGKSISGAPFGSLAVPLAAGFSLTIGIAALGHISGAHFNPAVTFGLAVNRRFPWKWVPAYWGAQLSGSALGALAIWAMYGGAARSRADLGAPAPAGGVNTGQAVVAEAIGTFVLVLVVVAVATDARAARNAAAGSIGLALLAALLITGPVSGGGLNPARSFGPMLIANTYTSWWVYLLAPLAAGALAVAVYDRVLRAGAQPE
jgi:MIP family channel proteins